jgi:hypothetical protein
LHQTAQKPFELLPEQSKLQVDRARHWSVGLKNGTQFWPLRLFAIKKPEYAAQRSRLKGQRRAQQHGVNIRPETPDLAGYALVLTNLESQSWPTNSILELYAFGDAFVEKVKAAPPH